MSVLHRVIATLCVAYAACLASAQAQPYPGRPLKLVVPYGPGASTDVVARMVGQKVAEELKQPVVVENRAGASGMIGSDFVAKSVPDGYTFLLATDGTHTGNPFLVKNHPFHPIRDVTPITMAAKNVMVLVAHPSLPVSDVAELIRYARKNPEALSYGSSGNGSPHHLAGVQFNQMAGTNIQHIAYKGGGPAVTDVVGGQIPLSFASLVSVAPHIKTGRLKVLGVTEKTRYVGLPNVPSISETVPGFEMNSWLAFFGPAGLPQPVQRTLHQAIVKALQAPDVRAKLDDNGLLVVANSPEEFAAQLKAEYEARARLIKQNNIQAD